jgi:hypothetical protein
MAFFLLVINIVIYLLIIVKCFLIQDKTPFFFNYLIISCLLNVIYILLLLSQLYYPIFTDVHYEMKEFLLLFQFIYFLLYFSKYNFFYNKSFEKFYTCLLHFAILTFMFVFLATFYPGTSFMMAFYKLFSNWALVIFLITLYGLYIVPTLLQKKFNKYFKRTIVLFLVSSLFINAQVLFSIQHLAYITFTAFVNAIFNFYFLSFISIHKGRYLND